MSAVRPPKQRRSRESYERVLDAAHALLEENGFEGFTVQEVAARSGVSVGAIYERFGNKETLLRAVHARLMESMSERWREGARRRVASVEGAGGGGRGLGRRDGAGHERQPQGTPRVHAPGGGRRGDLRARIGGQHRAEQGASSASLSRTPASSPIPGPAIALDVAFRIAYSTLARQVMYGPVFESDRRMGWKRLVDELAAPAPRTSCAGSQPTPI